jgi:hypothetical protein
MNQDPATWLQDSGQLLKQLREVSNVTADSYADNLVKLSLDYA